jgi:hypothetical protein
VDVLGLVVSVAASLAVRASRSRKLHAALSLREVIQPD